MTQIFAIYKSVNLDPKTVLATEASQDSISVLFFYQFIICLSKMENEFNEF